MRTVLSRIQIGARISVVAVCGVALWFAVGCNVRDPLATDEPPSNTDATTDTTQAGDDSTDASDVGASDTGASDSGTSLDTADGAADSDTGARDTSDPDTGEMDTGDDAVDSGRDTGRDVSEIDAGDVREDVCVPVQETCNGADDDCDGIVDEFCPCDYDGSSEGVCGGATRASDGTCSEPSDYEKDEASCDQKDNDCDGQTDENLSTELLREDFEGSDKQSWSKHPSGHNKLNFDTDIQNGSAPEGKEHAEAYYKHGVCEDVAGMAASKKVSGDVDEISVQVNPDIDNWGRTAIFLEDSSGNVTMLWRANAKGNSYAPGWTTLTFDRSTSFQKTTSNGTSITQNAIPSGVGNETITLIFGSDDNSQYCDYNDHTWRLGVDDLTVLDVCN